MDFGVREHVKGSAHFFPTGPNLRTATLDKHFLPEVVAPRLFQTISPVCTQNKTLEKDIWGLPNLHGTNGAATIVTVR